jgi:hypothetical protein
VIEGPKSVMAFATAAGLKNLETALLIAANNQKLSDLEVCEALLKILNESNPPGASFVKTTAARKLYRITTAKDPLDASLTFGNGGRANLGTCQRCEELPHIKASYGVYVAMDKATAIAEVGGAGLPFGLGDRLYEVTPIGPEELRFIDFDDAVMFLEQMINGVSLAGVVHQSPAAASWGMQKWPKPSQIVAEWLRQGLSSAADGIAYRSTKNPASKNAFLFADSAGSLRTKFSAAEIDGLPRAPQKSKPAPKRSRAKR